MKSITLAILCAITLSPLARADQSYSIKYNPNSYHFELTTPHTTIEMNSFGLGTGLIPITMGSLIPSEALLRSMAGPKNELDSFTETAKLPIGTRAVAAGTLVTSGLFTMALGASNISLVVPDNAKQVDPVTEFEKSPFFEAMKKEFGAEQAHEMVFKRMVENWRFPQMVKKFYKDPLRTKAIKMANEEYERLSPYKSAFGKTVSEQEAMLDARVGQIVALRIALESTNDAQSKEAIGDFIKALRNEMNSEIKEDEAKGTVEASVSEVPEAPVAVTPSKDDTHSDTAPAEPVTDPAE